MLTISGQIDYEDSGKKHPSIELRDKKRAALTGYIRRTALTAPALLEVLKEGDLHTVILKLRHSPGSREASLSARHH